MYWFYRQEIHPEAVEAYLSFSFSLGTFCATCDKQWCFTERHQGNSSTHAGIKRALTSCCPNSKTLSYGTKEKKPFQLGRKIDVYPLILKQVCSH